MRGTPIRIFRTTKGPLLTKKASFRNIPKYERASFVQDSLGSFPTTRRLLLTKEASSARFMTSRGLLSDKEAYFREVSNYKKNSFDQEGLF